MPKIKMSIGKAEEDENKRQEAKATAEKIAKDVSESPVEPEPEVEDDPVEDDPDDEEFVDGDYAKIALLRVTVGADDGRTMDEWLEAVKEDLSEHKNVTVLTKHFLIDGKHVPAHKVDQYQG